MDTTASPALQITDSLDYGESLNTFTCKTSIVLVDDSDSLMQVVTSGYDLQEKLVTRYSIMAGLKTNVVAQLCTAVVAHPLLAFSITRLHPIQTDSLSMLAGMHIPFLVLEKHILKGSPKSGDSLMIAPGVVEFFLRSYFKDVRVSEAWLYPPYYKSNGNLAASCRMLAYSDIDLTREALPLFAEITYDDNKTMIARLSIEGATSMSPLDEAIPLEGVGHISIRLSSTTLTLAH